MEGKNKGKNKGKSTNSGSHGEEKSNNSTWENSIFPRPTSTDSKRCSSHSDIFGPPGKQEYAHQAWIGGQTTIIQDEYSKSNTSKANREKTTVKYQGQRSAADPCSLSNSVYYGGQDICGEPPISQTLETYKKDGKDDSGNGSDFASRGNWWQGSLYY